MFRMLLSMISCASRERKGEQPMTLFAGKGFLTISPQLEVLSVLQNEFFFSDVYFA